jgi:hypothetical protein
MVGTAGLPLDDKRLPPPISAEMVGTAGFESIARVKSCVILHISATAKCKKVQIRGGYLSRFVTQQSRLPVPRCRGTPESWP